MTYKKFAGYPMKAGFTILKNGGKPRDAWHQTPFSIRRWLQQSQDNPRFQECQDFFRRDLRLELDELHDVHQCQIAMLGLLAVMSRQNGSPVGGLDSQLKPIFELESEDLFRVIAEPFRFLAVCFKYLHRTKRASIDA